MSRVGSGRVAGRPVSAVRIKFEFLNKQISKFYCFKRKNPQVIVVNVFPKPEHPHGHGDDWINLGSAPFNANKKKYHIKVDSHAV